MEPVLRALADESRRTMLDTLAGGPATAGELAALLPIARPGVSRHLRVLREAGLVEVRQEAQRRVYSLRPEPLAEVDEWLGRYRALWEQRLDALHRDSPGETRTKEHQMTSNARAGRILGSLRSADGKGVVRMEDRFDTDIEDLWSALTDPRRLARWIGEVEGDLRLGGEFRARFFASGWEGTGRVDACEPPRRLLLLTEQPGQPDEHVIEVTLTADGDHTILILEERGMPVNLLAAYGAGIQVHIEDLAAHIAGRERCDAKARWEELQPAYEALASKLG
jgi:DNA-binding transcriptional ArsR family regulator/uncharacterized protein YndB with AHSA1/START domain